MWHLRGFGKIPNMGMDCSLTEVRCWVVVGFKEILHLMVNSVWTFNVDRVRGELGRPFGSQSTNSSGYEFAKRDSSYEFVQLRIRQARFSQMNSSSETQYT